MPWRSCDDTTHGHQAIGKPVIHSTVNSAQNTLHWRHNERDGVLNHQRLDCLLKRLSGRRSKKTSKLRLAGLWEGNPSVIGGLFSQMTSSEGHIFIWWHHHGNTLLPFYATYLSVNDHDMVKRLIAWQSLESWWVGGYRSHIFQWWLAAACQNGRPRLRIHSIKKKARSLKF